MADVELLIKIPEDLYKAVANGLNTNEIGELRQAVVSGTVLTKGHGRLITESEILKFLKCPEYENCDWKNCFDCNKSRCININNVNQLVSIIEADKEVKE